MKIGLAVLCFVVVLKVCLQCRTNVHVAEIKFHEEYTTCSFFIDDNKDFHIFMTVLRKH